MRVQHLSTHSFRNLVDPDLELSERTILVKGDNGQGKTNLLEALYIAATGRSFRQARAREWVRFGQESASITATVHRKEVRHRVDIRVAKGRRHVSINERAAVQAGALFELVNVVAFFPDDLRILKGSPEERRRFLDRAVANANPPFVTASLKYQRALRERNALLRQNRMPDLQVLEAYDAQLVTWGVQVDAARQSALDALAPLVAQHFERITQTGVALNTRLVSGFERESGEQPAEESLAGALRDNRERDLARRQTTKGPHRGDLEVLLDDQSARSFGSQGQQRAAILALKLAELQWLEGEVGTTPILLLDDVSSELDVRRTELLFEQIEQCAGQTWISSTGHGMLPIAEKTQQFQVDGGKIALL